MTTAFIIFIAITLNSGIIMIFRQLESNAMAGGRQVLAISGNSGMGHLRLSRQHLEKKKR
jgi:hypothetical protein